MIILNDKDSFNLKVGERASYSDILHESVGYTNEYIIADESIIKCVESKTEYHNPEKLKQGMCGADEAEETFIFEALKKGETFITFKHLFRGDLEKEKKIKITVE